MDFWNNIWLAVSTPNEVLINILLALCAIFVEVPLSFSLITNIFNLNYTKTQKKKYIASIAAIALLTMYIIPNPFNILFNYCFGFITIHLIFKMTIIKNLISCILPSLILNLFVSLFLNPYLTILNITYEQVNTIPIYRMPIIILSYTTVYLFILLIKSKNITIKILDNLDLKNKYIFIVNFIFGFIYIIANSVLTINYIDILPIRIYFF